MQVLAGYPWREEPTAAGQSAAAAPATRIAVARWARLKEVVKAEGMVVGVMGMVAGVTGMVGVLVAVARAMVAPTAAVPAMVEAAKAAVTAQRLEPMVGMEEDG